MNPHIDLMQDWQRLAERAGLAMSAGLGAGLIARYTESQRAYHTCTHLRHVLGLMQEMRADDRLLLAAWFHDAIYRPGSSDNEERSAALARQALNAHGYPDAGIRFVCDAILSTATHHAADPSFHVLLDADLAVLGGTGDEYQAYCHGIRFEYAHVPETKFREGRAGFVRSVLARPQIFQTALCLGRFELPARRNLQLELAELLAPTGGRACN